jgi:hypothetical protein
MLPPEQLLDLPDLKGECGHRVISLAFVDDIAYNVIQHMLEVR